MALSGPGAAVQLVDGTGSPLGTPANPFNTDSGGGTQTAGLIAAGTITTGGTAVAAAIGPFQGGLLGNPTSATEPLYWNLVSAAGTVQVGTTFALLAGDYFLLPPSTSGTLSLNAATSGHAFNLVLYT